MWGTSKQHIELQNYKFRVSQFNLWRSQSGNDREMTTFPPGHHWEAKTKSALTTTTKLQQVWADNCEMTTFIESWNGRDMQRPYWLSLSENILWICYKNTWHMKLACSWLHIDTERIKVIQKWLKSDSNRTISKWLKLDSKVTSNPICESLSHFWVTWVTPSGVGPQEWLLSHFWVTLCVVRRTPTS